MRISIFTLQENKEDAWKIWGKKLEGQKDEVIETLKEEQAHAEFSFIFSIGMTKYMAIGMLGDDIQPSTDKPLNMEHRAAINNCVIEKIAKGEIVYCIEDR